MSRSSLPLKAYSDWNAMSKPSRGLRGFEGSEPARRRGNLVFAHCPANHLVAAVKVRPLEPFPGQARRGVSKACPEPGEGGKGSWSARWIILRGPLPSAKGASG
jgi:hypothetical protein